MVLRRRLECVLCIAVFCNDMARHIGTNLTSQPKDMMGMRWRPDFTPPPVSHLFRLASVLRNGLYILCIPPPPLPIPPFLPPSPASALSFTLRRTRVISL
jgi:hypothetical protein